VGTVRVLTVVHQRDAGPGVFGEAAEAAGHELVEWLPAEGPPPADDGFGAAMVFGGSMHVDQEEANPWLPGEKAFLRELLERGTPAVGVCLGSQLLAEAAGASPRRALRPEIGWHPIELTAAAGTPTSSRSRPAPTFWPVARSAFRPSACGSARSGGSSSMPRSPTRTWTSG
jgi:GMP synthase (glutamine-hydrolysing)